jgi:PAS domain S-box-containing protein
MKKLTAIISLLISQVAVADIFWLFREIDGTTNWQYIANFSSGILILALSFTVIRLFFSRRQSNQYNRQLEEIRSQLEQRVVERTTTLNESNSLLKKSNAALAKEINQHLMTTSQLRQSESYISEILQSMPLILIGLDKDNQITQWNPRAEDISGLPAAKVIGEDLWQSYPDITVTPQQIMQASTEQRPVHVQYSQYGQYHFDITIYPLKDQSITGVVLLIDDITQRVNSETMLIQKDKMSLMGEMTSAMAHDINMPLKAMLSSVKTLRQDITDDTFDVVDMRETLEDAVIRGQQAKSIIDSLLDFSQGGGDAKSLANITHIIDHSIDLARNAITANSGLRFHDVVLKRDYADDLLDLPCYHRELQQVFLSLIRQACSALGKVDDLDHSPEITIAVSQIYNDLWIRLHHNGKPLSDGNQKYLFESSGTDESSSAPYDPEQRLSFSHFIITEQHQGQIAVTSDTDSGTTFSIQLPLK